MGRLFGTDGIRGVANRDLTCELVFQVGQCGAQVLASEVHKPRILIGRDTRISGKMLRSALTAGICSVGAEVIDVGVIPTPGMAYLVREHGADAAVMISASHNSFEHNGIKWFSGQGFKLSDELENQMETLISGEAQKAVLPEGDGVGSYVSSQNAANEYIEYLRRCVKDDFSGFRVVLDCANGAASELAPKLFSLLGCTVYASCNVPDGININANCGSTHPKRLQRMVVEKGADIGIAFDGDADRLIAVDEYGVLVDGDLVMSICAMDMKQSGILKQNTLVATVMSNYGMRLGLEKAGIKVLCTDVGDRCVLECMREHGYNLGGEQSGHVIFLDKNTTGDGMLSALELMGVMARRKEKLSALSRCVEIFPQVLVNVRVPDESKSAFQEDPNIAVQIAQVEQELGERGRILVRASGTEPLVRIMIEGEEEMSIQTQALSIAHALASKYDGKIE